MRKARLETAYHASQKSVARFAPEVSRWGHGGVFATPEPREGAPYAYLLPGPFLLLGVEDWDTGSFHLLEGFGTDDEWNALVAELALAAGLGSDGPPWLLPRNTYGVDHFYDLHRLLRERLEAEGYDGWWLGGEVVLWNYRLLSAARAITPKTEVAVDVWREGDHG